MPAKFGAAAKPPKSTRGGERHQRSHASAERKRGEAAGSAPAFGRTAASGGEVSRWASPAKRRNNSRSLRPPPTPYRTDRRPRCSRRAPPADALRSASGWHPRCLPRRASGRGARGESQPPPTGESHILFCFFHRSARSKRTHRRTKPPPSRQMGHRRSHDGTSGRPSKLADMAGGDAAPPPRHPDPTRAGHRPQRYTVVGCRMFTKATW